MKKEFTLAVVLFALIVLVLVGFAASQFPVQSVTVGATCPLTMGHIVLSAQGDVYNMEGVTGYEEPESYYLASYEVQGDVISNPTFESVPNDLKDKQKDSALQNEAWQNFTELIPLQASSTSNFCPGSSMMLPLSA